ncbi:HD domain-containing phosphohydrolase [Povalibacter sp.]|uniref:HD domain-containing phosphohydrolase n=1 Tax=Povalibacter sp. TaxID=1962978 RepID=UPI002F42CFC9
MGLILVAYERESEQLALEKLLTPRGHRVIRASNGLEALEAARREPPHAVVCDIVLPRMDGFALCRKWKQDERLQSIPFLFYTRRHDNPKYESFALELGAERFLARSEQPDALVQALEELVAAATPAPASVPRPTPTVKLPALDEGAAQRSEALERSQQALAMATERAQQAQARLRNQIGELETTNQRLAAGEARFRRIFEANPLPMWIADQATGGFIAVNDTALTVYGYTRAEFLALKAAALLDPSSGEAGTDIVTHRRKDGSKLHATIASRPIEFDGRSADVVSVCDLTERIAAESAQRETLAANRSLVNALSDGYWLLDADNRIVEVNQAYCGMSGYTADELRNKPVAEIEERGAEAKPAAGGRYEARHKRRDGSFMDVEISAGRLEGSGRGDTLLVIRDISQRQRALESQRQERQQQDFLIDLFRQAETFDESAIVRRVVEQAAAVTGSPLAYFFFVQPVDKTMSLVAWRDQDKARTSMANAEPRPLARMSVFTECVRAGHATSSNDLTWKPQPDGLPDLQRYLAVPMIENGQAMAVLGVANRDAGYGEQDQKALAALSDGVWRMLHAKRAHAQTLGSLQRTDVALQGMIDALLTLSEKHDPGTAGSARRVAALAVALGREAGLDGERQHALRIAALLHDVGNISVPASLLSRPGPLTSAEMALMRTHVEEGCKLLANIDFGAPVAEILFEHHERLDGSGYPRGLKGEEILIEARILAIADVVEAMSSARPWRAPPGVDAAMDEINRGAGVTYDLHLATACTRLVRQHGFTFPD